MQVKIEVSVTEPDGVYNTRQVIKQTTDRQVPELANTLTAEHMTSADVETLRDVVAGQVRELGKELNRQLDFHAERVAERERKDRAAKLAENTASTF